jgi:hypothetical protein
MRTILLSLALISQVALADGLISVPKNMVAEQPKVPSASPSSPMAPLSWSRGRIDLDDSLVNNGNAKSYEDFFNNYIYGKKKQEMARWAATILVKLPNVRCFKDGTSHARYGFQRVSENDYKMNCHAGSGSRVTDIAEFRVTTFIPSPCPAEKDIKAYFADAKNRTRAKAQEFYGLRMAGCPLQISAADLAHPVVSITAVKSSYADSDVAESDTSVISSPVKPKPSRSGDGDDAPVRKPSCVPGNVFCHDSAE